MEWYSTRHLEATILGGAFSIRIKFFSSIVIRYWTVKCGEELFSLPTFTIQEYYKNMQNETDSKIKATGTGGIWSFFLSNVGMYE